MNRETIKVKTFEINEFLNIGKSIKKNGILPVLDCVLLDNKYLVKTNLNSYCRYTLSAGVGEGVKLLIDEMTLTGFMNLVAGTEITFTIKDNTVTMTDGCVDASYNLVHDAHLFPSFPQPTEEEMQREANGEKFVLRSTSLAAILNARHYVLDDEMYNFGYIHINRGRVLSTDRTVMFCYTLAGDDIPDDLSMALDPNEVTVLGDFTELTYSEFGNYNFFECNNFAHGFIKPDITVPEFDFVLNNVTTDVYFQLNKEDVQRFMEAAIQSTPAKLPSCTVQSKNGFVTMSLVDAEFCKSLTRSYMMGGSWQMDKPFTFNPRSFLRYFRALPYKTIRFSPFNNPSMPCFTIWTEEDRNFLGVVIGMAEATGADSNVNRSKAAKDEAAGAQQQQQQKSREKQMEEQTI